MRAESRRSRRSGACSPVLEERYMSGGWHCVFRLQRKQLSSIGTKRGELGARRREGLPGIGLLGIPISIAL